jgi:deoxyribose-phosphate aldolase
MEIKREQIARMIDHTLLKPTATRKNIIKLCGDAKKYNFASVVVNPIYVPLAVKAVKGTNVRVCTVIGFPLGANTFEVKAFEAKKAAESGAQELDMVMNISAFKSRDYRLVKKDIEAVVKTAKEFGSIITKVIIETGFLTDEEKVKACLLAREAKADFVKTSTGFGPSGATVHDVRLMRKTVGEEMGVKAAGGIRTFEDAIAMIKAGANRIGTSAGVEIIEGIRSP